MRRGGGKTRRVGNGKNTRGAFTSRLYRLILQWLLFIPLQLRNATVRFYFDIGFIVAFLAAVLLYFLAHLLLVEDHPTFSVVATRNNWDVERKAILCRRAGRFYVLLSLFFLTPHVAFTLSRVSAFVFHGIVSGGHSNRGRAGEWKVSMLAVLRGLARFSMGIVYFLFWLFVVTPWRTIVITHRLYAEGMSARLIPSALLRLARQWALGVPQRVRQLCSEEIWSTAPFRYMEGGSSTNASSPVSESVHRALPRSPLPPLVSPSNSGASATARIKSVPLFPPSPVPGVGPASLSERRNHRVSSGNSMDHRHNNDNNMASDFWSGKRAVSGNTTGASGRNGRSSTSPPLGEVFNSSTSGSAPPLSSPSIASPPHAFNDSSTALYGSPLQDNVFLLRSPEGGAGKHSRTSSSGSGRVLSLASWGGMHQRQYSRTLRTSTPPVIPVSTNKAGPPCSPTPAPASPEAGLP